MKVKPVKIMKRLGNLYTKLIDLENLKKAVVNACKPNGRTSPSKRKAIEKAKSDIEGTALEIQKIIINGNITSRYSIYPFYEPKLRLIYALPFYPDRIVHHALLNILEDFWDNQMQSCSYACRKNKGQHQAGQKCAEYTRKYKYCAQFDISQFYIAIDHEILKKVLRKKLKDKKILEILDEIIDSISTRDMNLKILHKLKSRGQKNPYIQKEIDKLNRYEETFRNTSGLPIGSYTSQWMGNLYMNELDTYLKQVLKCKAVVRYCDDFIVFSNDKEELQKVKIKVKEFLFNNLHLLLSKSEVFPTAQGVYFCGYRYFPKGYVLLRKRTAKKEKKTIKQVKLDLASGRISKESALSKVASIDGLFKWANCYNLKKSLGIEELLKTLKE